MRINSQLKVISYVTAFAFIVMIPVLIGAFFDFNQAKSNYVLAESLNRQHLKSNSLRNQYILYDNPYVLEQLDTQETENKGLLQQAISQMVDEEDQQLLQQIPKHSEKIRKIFGRVINTHGLMVTSNIDQRSIYAELEKRLISQLLLKTSEIGQILQSLLNNANTRIQKDYEKLVIVTILFTLLLATTIIVVMTKLGRLISKKLAHLHEGAKIVAGGDLNYRIHDAGEDEFSELAQSINSVTSNLQSFTQKLESEIDARKKTEADLIEAKVTAEIANSAKSEFLAAMSHELRTPLTSSLGSLGLIKGVMSGGLSDEVAELIEISYRNNETLLRLVDELLDYEKILSGAIEIDTHRQNVCELTLKTIRNSQGFARTHSVRFVVDELSTPLYADVQEHRFEQVLNNLLSNAAKFSKAGNDIEIAVENDNESIFVRVKDYGSGIPEEFRAKIFDQFSQVDSSTTRQQGGTGLGLPISKALTEAMGGTLEFETELNVGSTFSIIFPSSQ